jgi:glycosyltransferase involved in cell wall biosynthesis
LFPLLLLVTLIQLGGYLLGFLLLLFYRPKAKIEIKKTAQEGLSLIVAARNEADNLRQHLPLWLAQQGISFELIVVNDRSTDATAAVLAECQQQHPQQLKVVTVAATPAGYGAKKWALLQAAEAASYPHLLLTDADCAPSSSYWAAHMFAPLVQKQLVLGLAPLEHPDNQPLLLRLLINFETQLTAFNIVMSSLLGRPLLGLGRNMAYHRQLLTNGWGRFNHLPAGDDDLLVNHLPATTPAALVLHPQALAVSAAPEGWRNWWRQKQRHLSVGRHYRSSSLFLLGLWQASLVLIWLLSIAAVAAGKPEWAAISFCSRWAAAAAAFWLLKKHSGHTTVLILLPFAELLHLFYLLMGNIAALRPNKTTWK